MYLPQSGFDKLSSALEVGYDAAMWEKSNMNEDLIKDGYAYFESTEVYYKKKKSKTLLIQMLNPAFSHKVKIFYDPLAGEQAGVGIGGVKLAGGGAKSYFIQINDAPAFKLKKKNYKETADMIYTECPDFKDKIEKWKWNDFAEVLYEYTQYCE